MKKEKEWQLAFSSDDTEVYYSVEHMSETERLEDSLFNINFLYRDSNETQKLVNVDFKELEGLYNAIKNHFENKSNDNISTTHEEDELPNAVINNSIKRDIINHLKMLGIEVNDEIIEKITTNIPNELRKKYETHDYYAYYSLYTMISDMFDEDELEELL